MHNTNRYTKWLLKIILAATPFGAAAQSIHITSGAHLIQQGRIYMMLNNMGFVNDGIFDGGTGGIVEFAGNAPLSISSIGGTSNTPFGNLLIAKSSGDVSLRHDITINLALSMILGNLELGGNTVTFGHHGTITRETETGHITGANGGSVVATSDIIANTATYPGNLGAELLIPGTTGSVAGTFTVVRNQLQDFHNSTTQGIGRTYTITSATNTPVTGQLRFNYLNAELNGIDPTTLNLYTSDSTGTGHVFLGKDSGNTTGKWVVKSGIGLLGHFTLGPGPATTATARSKTTASNQSASDAATAGVKVYPNPARDLVLITLVSQEAKEIQFSLYDQWGHLVQQKTIHCVAGSNQVSWDIAHYAAGVYYLSFNNPGAKNIKIVKE